MTMLKCEFIEIGRLDCGCCGTIAMWPTWQHARDKAEPTAYFVYPIEDCATLSDLMADVKNCTPGTGKHAGQNYDPELYAAEVGGRKPN